MEKRINLCVIGCGRFSGNFVPLFKAHPAVKQVSVCDLRQERANDFSARWGVPVVRSFEDALKDPGINAVAIFTERQTHGPLVIRALKAGKHVYSAVPCSVDPEEIAEIAELVKKTRLTYSMGETGYYRAATCFLRREFRRGTFGDFVSAEAQYNHDIRNMENSFRSSSGENWKAYAGIPPLFYPTHSTSMILGALPGVYARTVSALGYVPASRQDIFDPANNVYANPFGNEVMLLRLSNGGVARVSENRTVGWKAPETYVNQFFGTAGCYEFSVADHYLAVWDPATAAEGKLPTGVRMRSVTEELLPTAVTEALRADRTKGVQMIADGAGFFDVSPIQPVGRLPKEFEGLPNGHNGTHQFLVDDFCRAVTEEKLSPTNVWQVARFNLPGLIAHASALRDGETLPVPDLGEPPADWPLLKPNEAYD